MKYGYALLFSIMFIATAYGMNDKATQTDLESTKDSSDDVILLTLSPGQKQYLKYSLIPSFMAGFGLELLPYKEKYPFDDLLIHFIGFSSALLLGRILESYMETKRYPELQWSPTIGVRGVKEESLKNMPLGAMSTGAYTLGVVCSAVCKKVLPYMQQQITPLLWAAANKIRS